MTKRIYQDQYFIGLFGMLTGVASTGLALLKGVDPNLETPVAEEMVLGSGTAITMALPLFAILFIPSLNMDGNRNVVGICCFCRMSIIYNYFCNNSF